MPKTTNYAPVGFTSSTFSSSTHYNADFGFREAVLGAEVRASRDPALVSFTICRNLFLYSNFDSFFGISNLSRKSNIISEIVSLIV